MKFKTSVVFCALVTLMLTSVPLAKADTSTAPGQVCKRNGDYGFSHDTCVVCVAQGANAATCFCKMALDEGVITSGEQYGQCVAGGGVGPNGVSLASFSLLLAAAGLFQLRRKVKVLRS